MVSTTRVQKPSAATARHGKPPARQVLRVLVAIDGSEGTGRVLNHVLRLQQRYGGVEVVVLNVQPKPQDWRLRGWGWFQREAIHDRLINDLGRRVIAGANRQLDAAGIAHRDRIELGEAGETIARCAREEGCDLVVLTEPRPGAVRAWLMRKSGLSPGSIASIVVHLAGIPVVLVP
jgi:nucleotide-binding universal stress UspA family protein